MKEIIALVLFILMSILMFVFSNRREYTALLCALVYVLLGILPADNIVKSIDFNVLFMMSGTMIVVYYFIESRMPVLAGNLFVWGQYGKV